MTMQARYVVIPAFPQERERLPRRVGVACEVGTGYDLYDTHDKIRLSLNLPTRAEADYQCASRNSQAGADGSQRVGHG
ncbi:hypothetical protein ACIPZF_17855 [Pseudomonas sp. NPDC089752]|uniref:hypothetical protein n=1 Tax=Pseudomonas sp. NPDC089752 TaxID=3364472 RepID=UPI0038001FCB